MSDLKGIAGRIACVDAEIKDLQEQRKDMYAEAKSSGFTVSALRKAIALHWDSDKREKHENEQADLILYLDELNRVEPDPMQRIKEAVS